MAQISADLLDILVCPKCQSKLALNYEDDELACTNVDCKLVYPIKDGIPVLLIAEAKLAD